MSKKKRVKEVVNAQLAQFLGERRRVGEIEKHHDQLLADWPMIGTEHDTGEQRAADQSAVSVTTPPKAI
jgi:hypothetical protein